MAKIDSMHMTVGSMAELMDVLKTLPSDLQSLHIDVRSNGSSPANTPEDDAPPAEPTPVYSMEEVRAVLFKVRDLHGVEGMRDLMRPYGTEKLAGLAPKHYGAVLEAAQKVIADAG